MENGDQPEQTPNQYSQEPQDPKENRFLLKNPLFITGIVFVLVVGGMVGVYFLFSYTSTSETENVTKNEESALTAQKDTSAKQTEPPEGWVKYDGSYLLSFYHPQDWIVEDHFDYISITKYNYDPDKPTSGSFLSFSFEDLEGKRWQEHGNYNSIMDLFSEDCSPFALNGKEGHVCFKTRSLAGGYIYLFNDVAGYDAFTINDDIGDWSNTEKIIDTIEFKGGRKMYRNENFSMCLMIPERSEVSTSTEPETDFESLSITIPYEDVNAELVFCKSGVFPCGGSSPLDMRDLEKDRIDISIGDDVHTKTIWRDRKYNTFIEEMRMSWEHPQQPSNSEFGNSILYYLRANDPIPYSWEEGYDENKPHGVTYDLLTPEMLDVIHDEVFSITASVRYEGCDRESYGGPFYRKDDKVFADDPQNRSINNLELPDADPDSFSHLQGRTGYDKDNFHYLKFDEEARTFEPVHVPIGTDIKKLFDLVDVPGVDVKIVWRSNTDVVFDRVAYKKLSRHIGIYELLNKETVVGYLWANDLDKTNIVNNKLYLYTDSNATRVKPAVYEVAYGNQPEIILDIDPDKTTFKPGGSKIYYTKPSAPLNFYEFDTVTGKERKIPVQYQGTTTSPSRVTVSPDEKLLLLKSHDEDEKTSTLLIDVNTGDVEVVRKKESSRWSGDLPFAVSPSNDKVFFLSLPYEGYAFTSPSYVEKDEETGVWSDELRIPSIHMEVGGGWNIDTGQWSISPSGRYLAVADATENSIHSCTGYVDIPKAHNVIKILDMETLETQTLTMESPNVHFTLNSWVTDESGIFATKRKIEMHPTRDCGEPTGGGVQKLYSR